MTFIDKFFCINLDERSDRLKHFFEECKKHNIPNNKIVRFSAINGKTYKFNKNEINMFKNADFNTSLLTSNIIQKKLMGNQLSHYYILLEMKQKNYDYIIIFQDDVTFKKGFINYIDEIIKDIPDDAEIINLGLHAKADCEKFEPYDLSSDETDNFIINKKVTNFVYEYKIWNSKTRYRVNPASLAYIVTKKGCNNLIEHFNNKGFLYSTDWNYNLYLQSKNIFYGSKYVLATGNNKFISDVFIDTDNYSMTDLIDTNIYYIDKNLTHSYFDLYSKLFEPIRKSAKNILEIGIGVFGEKNGGSLLLWKLFFKNSIIHAVDTIEKKLLHDIVLKNKNILTYLNTDAYDSNFTDNFKKNKIFFDVIIDDGQHTFYSQCKCIELYSDLLTDNGILVIEDVQDISFIEKFKELTPEHLKKYIHIYDLRHIKNRYDDIVFVINENIINDKYNNTNNEYNNDINIPIVISYENDSSNVNSLLFKKTLQKNNWDFKFIGEGIKWCGFKDRIFGYYNELKLYNDDKVIVLSDARDVFCLRKHDFLIENIKNIIENKIIVSAELFLIGHMNWNNKQIENALSNDKNFFWQGVPLDKYWDYYNKKDNLPNRKYINAGLIIGKTKNLKKMFEWLIENNYNDDQLGISNYANIFPEKVHLDYDATFLHTTGCCVNGSLYNYNIQVTDTPTFPELFGLSSYFLHIPGSNISKGQINMYKCVYKLFDTDIIKNMFDIYNIKPKNNKNHNSYFITNDN